MALVVVLWAAIGALVGALANAARLQPVSWGRRGWLGMVGLGVASALVGGGLGVLLFGAFFATGATLWVAVVGVVAGPPLIARGQARRAGRTGGVV